MDGRSLCYCPDCGESLVSRRIESRTRSYCVSCETPVYRNPKPCAGVLVIDDQQLLLVKRTNPPGVGTWAVPAGFLEYDEPPQTGAARELEEETNITVSEDDLDLFDTVFVTAGDRENVLVVIYRVDRCLTQGEPIPSSDAGDARFWNMDSFENSDERIEPGFKNLFHQARTY